MFTVRLNDIRMSAMRIARGETQRVGKWTKCLVSNILCCLNTSYVKGQQLSNWKLSRMKWYKRKQHMQIPTARWELLLILCCIEENRSGLAQIGVSDCTKLIVLYYCCFWNYLERIPWLICDLTEQINLLIFSCKLKRVVARNFTATITSWKAKGTIRTGVSNLKVFLVPTNLFTTCEMINTNAGGRGRGGLNLDFKAPLCPRFTRGLLFLKYFTLSLFISSKNCSIFQFWTMFIVKSPVAFSKALCCVTSSRSLKQLFLHVETFSLLFVGLRTV